MTPPDPHPPSLRKSRSDNAVANSLNLSRSSTRVLYSSWLEPMPSAPAPAVGRTFLEQWIADQTPDAASKLAAVQLQAEVSLSGLPGAAAKKKAEDVDEVTQGPLRRRWTTGTVEERPRSLELRGVGAFAEDAEPSSGKDANLSFSHSDEQAPESSQPKESSADTARDPPSRGKVQSL
ncbi:hypothetical protein ACRE_086810 [Hapsidospora chrysogenum ATCC 11550]|uniref:Uncharacterized protein n=1 Tax=Hapsidospora chrysogenum (strain ATCC 11550 / CBS 779.69 / DSM 880 / IAM 14645 / JCM 23072 / IMI 49137) TaxID=857340 RepID=A0A086SU53_HAPC1|nr:hypothetical protein ACRE_086810 [Hapsidospora chrysogenum ATCC 11550]